MTSTCAWKRELHAAEVKCSTCQARPREGQQQCDCGEARPLGPSSGPDPCSPGDHYPISLAQSHCQVGEMGTDPPPMDLSTGVKKMQNAAFGSSHTHSIHPVTDCAALASRACIHERGAVLVSPLCKIRRSDLRTQSLERHKTKRVGTKRGKGGG